MNEALLLSAVRHHELMEEADTLNRKLEAEIRERQRVEIENEQLAYYDALTDLPNRRLLLDRLHHAILTCRRTMHHGAILFVDLDRFKIVNDTRGHHFGDLLLHQVAHRLKLSVREGDTVARLGGDEFVIVLEDLSEDAAQANEQAEKIGTKILGLLQPPYSLEEHQHYCTGSIGITVFGRSKESVEGLLRQADLAQYRAKAAGGQTIRFFDPEMQAKAVQRAQLDIELRNAIQEKQFIVHYQPQVDSEGYLCGVEALLRWNHPRRGLLLPSDFIFHAEDHGLIEAMGLWIIDTACRQLREWTRNPETSHLTIAINVSYREFRHPEFVDRVLSIIDETNVNPTKLILELTERVAFDFLEETLTKMSALTSHGLSFALDDFGMGFSSLSCIKNLPVSQIKIDRSFVCDILTSQSDAVIASAILSLARNLGLSAVAEGVETEEQFTLLATYGCRIFQGFFFGAPQPIDHLVVDRRKMGS
jgi:diguanylate cyclase (GGDEF)-like protein